MCALHGRSSFTAPGQICEALCLPSQVLSPSQGRPSLQNSLSASNYQDTFIPIPPRLVTLISAAIYTCSG